MEEQIQQKPTNTPTEVQQPKSVQTQPVKEKKSRWWIWLIIALAVIGVGVGIYFLGKYLEFF